MKFKGWFYSLVLPALIFCAPNLNAETTSLVWHRNKDRVDADITGGELKDVLEKIATTTGWKVYLDPDANHKVSAKFKDFSSGEALHSLLGNLNFMLVPQTNHPARLYVFRSSRDQATRLISPVKKAAEPIPNELVVKLKPDSKTKIEDLAKSLNAKVLGRIDGQNAYLLQFPDDAATQLARVELASNSDVAGTDVNFPVDAPPVLTAAESASPNLQLKPKSNDGSKQLIIGLIDTPVQSLGANLDSFMLPQIHVAGDVQPSTDQLTHGTGMAETILDAVQTKTGGSTSVQILPVDVYGNNETTTTFDVAKGIQQAVDNNATSLNLSLGGTGDSSTLHDIINQVIQRGITIYAAAGNDPVTTPTYPAAYPGVIAVTATDNTGNIAPYANRGSFVDMTAPGDNVVSFNGQNYLVEGTSTATAFASGAAAGMADAARVSASQGQALLQQTSPKASLPK